MLYLTPLIMGGGETEVHVEDPAVRGAPSSGDPRTEDRGTPLQSELRRRRLDQVFNAPLPGEVVPLGFVTFGAAHASLRHALALLGLTGRLPILRLGCINPFDPRSVEQMLSRCERLIVVENGRPFIEQSIRLLADGLRRSGHRAGEVFGKVLPGQDSAPPRVSSDAELHPSDLAEALGELLAERRTATGHETVAQRLASLPAARALGARISLERHRREPREQSLIRPLVDAMIDQLRDELSLPAPDRAASELRV
jgi:TPP-dependent indolepyruvate ferredoxin oxidoreductase alpha subunit